MLWYLHLKCPTGYTSVQSHTTAVIGHQLFSVFPARPTSSSPSYIFTLFAFHTLTLRWTCVSVRHHFIHYNDKPTILAYDDQLYLWTHYGLFCNAIMWCFQPSSQTWQKISMSGTLPSFRTGYRACVIDAYWYLLGGFQYREDAFTNDVYRYHFGSCVWEKMQVTGCLPPDIWYDATCVIGHRIYVFQRRCFNSECSHEIHYLDTVSMQWYKPQTHGQCPTDVYRSAVVYQNDIFLLCNTVADPQIHLYKLSLSTHTWSKMHPLRSLAPIVDVYHCHVIHDQLFVFGCNSLRGHTMCTNLSIFNFSTTLVALCIQKAIVNKLNVDCLPTCLKKYIQYGVEIHQSSFM